MSITSANILTIIEALHDKCALVTNVDYVFPTATRFSEKSDYWAFVDSTNDTQTEIETELINACWINYLRFEDDKPDHESPTKTIYYEITIFNEATFERLDEPPVVDTFNAKVSLTDHNHDTAVFSLQGEFQGINPLGLDSETFTVSETFSVVQVDQTERLVPCAFIIDEKVPGSQSKFIVACKIQTVAC